MKRSVLAIAVAAIIGIGVCFLVIGTPAVTTLRVTAKAFSSPRERASSSDFSEVSPARLGSLIEERPNDWKLRFLETKGVHDPELFASRILSPNAGLARLPAYRQIVRQHPELVVARSAYAKELLAQDLDYLDAVRAKQAEQLWREMGPEQRKLYATPPYKPYPARNTKILNELEDDLKHLQRQEPGNAAWPCFLAYCSLARLDDQGTVRYLREAATKRYWSLHQKDEYQVCVDAFATCGIPRPEAALRLGTYLEAGSALLDASMQLLTTSGRATRLARELEDDGHLKEAVEIRIALIDIGRLMERNRDSVMTGITGSSITNLAYPWYRQPTPRTTGPPSEKDMSAARLAAARRGQRLLAAELREAGMEGLIPKYAHTLEEDFAYGEAAQKVIDRSLKDITRPFTLMGIAYSPASVGWAALAPTCVLLAIVGIAWIPPRWRGKKAASRTVVRLGVAGAAVCLGLLAAAAVIAARFSGDEFLGLGAGFSDGGWGAEVSHGVWAYEWNLGTPTHALAVGIAMVLIYAGITAGLLARPSRRRAELLATFAPISSAAFWGYVWYSWYSGPYANRNLTIGLQIALAVACVGAIVAVWRAWARGGRGRVSPWVPLAAVISIGVVFSSLFITKRVSIGPEWPLLLTLLVPVSVVLGALVAYIVARRRDTSGERPSYLAILRPAVMVCLAWLLVLQFASLVWLGAWRAKAAGEIERAYATSENQAVLKIMREMHHEPETQ